MRFELELWKMLLLHRFRALRHPVSFRVVRVLSQNSYVWPDQVRPWWCPADTWQKAFDQMCSQGFANKTSQGYEMSGIARFFLDLGRKFARGGA